MSGSKKKRDLQATQAEEDGEDTLLKIGKQLIGSQKKSKDTVLKALTVSSNFPPSLIFQIYTFFWT